MLLYSNALPDANYTITGVGGSGTGVNIPTMPVIIEQPAPQPQQQPQQPQPMCSGCKPGTSTPTVTPGTSATVASGMGAQPTGEEAQLASVTSGDNYGLLLLLLALGFATYHAVKERRGGAK